VFPNLEAIRRAIKYPQIYRTSSKIIKDILVLTRPRLLTATPLTPPLSSQPPISTFIVSLPRLGRDSISPLRPPPSRTPLRLSTTRRSHTRIRTFRGTHRTYFVRPSPTSEASSTWRSRSDVALSTSRFSICAGSTLGGAPTRLPEVYRGEWTTGSSSDRVLSAPTECLSGHRFRHDPEPSPDWVLTGSHFPDLDGPMRLIRVTLDVFFPGTQLTQQVHYALSLGGVKTSSCTSSSPTGTESTT
jgi:hypothetical protein